MQLCQEGTSEVLSWLQFPRGRHWTFLQGGWPRNKPSPRSMVEAGFFYFGHEDWVQCVECGGVLSNWGKRDYPMFKHARYFPACPYVKWAQKTWDRFELHPLSVPGLDLPPRATKKRMYWQKLYHYVQTVMAITLILGQMTRTQAGDAVAATSATAATVAAATTAPTPSVLMTTAGSKASIAPIWTMVPAQTPTRMASGLFDKPHAQVTPIFPWKGVVSLRRRLMFSPQINLARAIEVDLSPCYQAGEELAKAIGQVREKLPATSVSGFATLDASKEVLEDLTVTEVLDEVPVKQEQGDKKKLAPCPQETSTPLKVEECKRLTKVAKHLQAVSAVLDTETYDSAIGMASAASGQFQDTMAYVQDAVIGIQNKQLIPNLGSLVNDQCVSTIMEECEDKQEATVVRDLNPYISWEGAHKQNDTDKKVRFEIEIPCVTNQSLYQHQELVSVPYEDTKTGQIKRVELHEAEFLEDSRGRKISPIPPLSCTDITGGPDMCQLLSNATDPHQAKFGSPMVVKGVERVVENPQPLVMKFNSQEYLVSAPSDTSGTIIQSHTQQEPVIIPKGTSVVRLSPGWHLRIPRAQEEDVSRVEADPDLETEARPMHYVKLTSSDESSFIEDWTHPSVFRIFCYSLLGVAGSLFLMCHGCFCYKLTTERMDDDTPNQTPRRRDPGEAPVVRQHTVFLDMPN